MKKNVLDNDEERNKNIEKLQFIYYRIDCLNDEKLELTEKLFLMQENFIRKLDQQIEKTEEDKSVQEKCNQDFPMEDGDLVPQFGKMGIKSKRTITSKAPIG